jgi:hypothetical protein
LEALKTLLKREKPHHLEELRIIDCQPVPYADSLLNFLTLEESMECCLSKLSLINVEFSDISFKLLLRFIRESRTLKELNISYNHFSDKEMS